VFNLYQIIYNEDWGLRDKRPLQYWFTEDQSMTKDKAIKYVSSKVKKPVAKQEVSWRKIRHDYRYVCEE
jgi:hypothetical protein